MITFLFLLLTHFETSSFFNLYDVDETTPVVEDMEYVTTKPFAALQDDDFEPVTSLRVYRRDKGGEKIDFTKNLNCEDFATYEQNCSLKAAEIYNSSGASPPLPSQMGEWCRSIRQLTNCAIDWNSECQDVTESHFNAESIKGHMHVVESVCDDRDFLSQYDSITSCLQSAGAAWVACYSDFKAIVTKQKNKSEEWTHYVTHFHLCCARSRFRRCIFDALFHSDENCTQDQAITLQKFSVIVSEGDVFQDCDHNMMYVNCPGGDPRPHENNIVKLMNANTINIACARNSRFDAILWCVCLVFSI